jgi:transposase-like protein
MSKQLKKYNSDFKLKVVLKYLSERSTAAQICQEFGISKAAMHKWVKQFKDNSGSIFNESDSLNRQKKERLLAEKDVSNLYAKIGQLTIERDFLKKVLDS